MESEKEEMLRQHEGARQPGRASEPDRMRDIVDAVLDERRYMDAKWGAHGRSVPAWLLIMEEEVAEAKKAWVKTEGDENALREILQVIACGVACLEQHGVVRR